MAQVSFHPEILTEAQRRSLTAMGGPLQNMGFAMAGGTALALLLGHRRSEDFDWFNAKRVADPLALAGELTQRGVDFTIEQTARGTLHGQVGGVRTSLLEYRYPLLAPSILWPDFSCLLLSLDDIAAMKLSAIVQRGSRKDFVDLYALLEEHQTLPELFELYRKKYDVPDIAPLLTAVAYFDDAEQEPMPQMLWPVSWSQSRERITSAVRELANGR